MMKSLKQHNYDCILMSTEFTTLFQELNLSTLQNNVETKHLSDIGKSKENADWMPMHWTKVALQKKSTNMFSCL